MTADEHLAEAERLIASAGEQGLLAEAFGTLPLARVHLEAARVITEMETAALSREMRRDSKSSSAFLTDMVAKLVPGDG